VFLSYAKEDVGRVKQIYADLKAAGHQPWMDTYDLNPGQDWKAALQLAISKCDAALICLSNNSVSKTGWQAAASLASSEWSKSVLAIPSPEGPTRKLSRPRSMSPRRL
jgi:hypothetical protein